MTPRKTLVAIIVLGMSLGASGCAKLSVSSAKMCMAHGGKWDAAAATCNGVAAQAACEQTGTGTATYNPRAQVCDFSW